MKYSCILFDLDGTLLNTLEDLASSVNFSLSQAGYPNRTLTEVKNFVGNGVRKLIERSVPGGCTYEETERCLSIFKNHYLEHMYDTTCVYSGILSLLDSLKEHSISCAIVSNKLDAAVKELSNRFFSDYITTAIGTPPEAKKPNPYCIYAAVKELNAPICDSIYVGDSEVDIETARNASIPCIGVSWGFRGRETLLKHGADYIVDTPDELLKLLLSL